MLSSDLLSQCDTLAAQRRLRTPLPRQQQQQQHCKAESAHTCRAMQHYTTYAPMLLHSSAACNCVAQKDLQLRCRGTSQDTPPYPPFACTRQRTCQHCRLPCAAQTNQPEVHNAKNTRTRILVTKSHNKPNAMLHTPGLPYSVRSLAAARTPKPSSGHTPGEAGGTTHSRVQTPSTRV